MVPWLVYRDLGSLTISRVTLEGLTPVAQMVLKQRQDTIQAIQSFLPWVSGMVFVVGVVLAGWGGKRMKDAQHWEDRGLRARTQQEEASIRPQTKSEREERIAEEVPETASAPGADGLSDGSGSTQIGAKQSKSPLIASVRRRTPTRVPDAIREAVAVQEEALDRIEAITPTGVSFEREVIVSLGESRLSLDGLLQASSAGVPDVLVEIKVYRSMSSVLARSAEQMIASVVRYRDMTGRPVLGWLIFVSVGDTPIDRFVQRTRDTLGTYGRLTVTNREDIGSLELPY